MTAFSPDAETSAALRWRIPPEGDPRHLRLKLAQTGLAAVVGALILLVTAPPELLGFGLVTLIPLTVGLAFWQWRRYRRSLEGPPNTWLDEAGLHWLDAAGGQQSLPRGDVTAYRIGIEEDTLRPVPALTFELRGGRESQPLELHDPATPDQARRWLADQWQIAERPAAPPAPSAAYDLAIDVYSECHDEFQEWHLEGTKAALGELFDAMAETAQLPLSPVGVKPARRVILARRRDTSRLAIEHDRHMHLGRDTICGTGEVLNQLAALGRAALQDSAAAAGGDADLRRDLVLGKGNVWTFHLHIRQ